ncbi:N amino acid transport system protein [Colletotrichum fructicola]|nr:N amino acid transport system protein [Colletotrichum fructicola]
MSNVLEEKHGGKPCARSESVMGGTLQDVEVQDEVFGAITKDGPNYRALGWKGSIVVMLKTQIGLGVLTIPKVFAVLGLIPGTICVIVVATMITWANYVVGAFKLRHPTVYGIEDVGRMFMGKFGYEFFGWLFAIYWMLTAGASFIGLSTCLNALSKHGACTAIFVAVASVIGFVFGSIQTLGRISWLAWVGFSSILSALMVLTISVGVQDRPAAAPQINTTWVSDYVLFANPTPSEAFAAISSIIFSFAGTPAFFQIVAEMRDPRMYTRAVMVCQSIMTALYITIGIVVYYHCGTYVTSPVLGSAGPLMKKICYGLALPGLTVSSAMFIHFTGKYLFLRFMRGSPHLTRNSVTHWAVWIGCTGVNALLSYIVASAIPVFSGLVSLVGAFGGTLMSLQPMGAMWLYDNWNGKRTPLWILTFAWVVFVIVMGSFMTVAGSYGAVVGIINDYKASGGSAAWSCADNSSS